MITPAGRFAPPARGAGSDHDCESKRQTPRHGLGSAVQRLLSRKSTGAGDSLPSPSSRSMEPPLARASFGSNASDPQPAADPADGAAGPHRSPTKQLRALWGKLGASMKKSRRSSAASAEAAPGSSGGDSPCAPDPGAGGALSAAGGSMELEALAAAATAAPPEAPAAQAVGLSAKAAAAVASVDGVGASCDESHSFYSFSPGRTCSAGSSPFVPSGAYYDETLDLRQVRVGAGLHVLVTSIDLARAGMGWVYVGVQHATESCPRCMCVCYCQRTVQQTA